MQCEENISIWKALALAFENNICVDGISEDCDKMLLKQIVSKMKPFLSLSHHTLLLEELKN